MSSRGELDTRFSLPAVDDSPMTEAGVILMGLDTERLLAGLGMATLADDPALVALAVDRVRHGVRDRTSVDALVATGCRRWRSARGVVDPDGRGGTTSASLRDAWAQTLRLVSAAEAGRSGPATCAYLAACWLRREAVDRCADRLAP